MQGNYSGFEFYNLAIFVPDLIYFCIFALRYYSEDNKITNIRDLGNLQALICNYLHTINRLNTFNSQCFYLSVLLIYSFCLNQVKCLNLKKQSKAS